jgi:uncharacterized membrane protein
MSKHPVNKVLVDQRGISDRIADVVAAFAGNMKFIYLHAAIFGIWMATGGFGTDAFPFNLLTMVVSLEAIFLTTLVMISQNRQSASDRLTLEHEANETEQLLSLQEGQTKELGNQTTILNQQTEILNAIHEHLTGEASVPSA